MTSRAVLRFQGSLEQGFRVTLNIRDRQGAEVTEIIGALPGAPELITQLEDWQQQYRQGIGTSRIALESIKVKAGSFAQLEACRVAGRQLQRRLVAWLESPEFNPIDRRLREMLDPREAAELLVRTEDQRLHRLPWHCWDFIERYPRTEVIFGSVPERLPIHCSSSTKVRVLSILGDRRNINTDVDRQILEQLPQAEVTFLVEPSRQEVDRCLWEESWDVLFFAGHSHSQEKQGYLNLNAEESLTIEELRYGLKRAIAQGLQLAIFNSCDGLGLAYELEQLHIPQLMVMREPIPDAVAQAFLKYFLQSYARGESLHLALREARERLQSLEKEFPWATWLPVLFQNPAMNAPTWQQLQAVLPRGSLAEPAVGTATLETAAVTDVQPTAPSSVMQLPAAQLIASSPARAAQLGTAGRSRKFWQSLGLRLGLGLTVSLSIVGLRYGGLLQSAELAVFDHFLRGRASEPEDDRILVVEVTDEDIQAQDAADPLGRSLSDQTLLKLLTTLDSYGPKAIGLDLYRYESTDLQPLAQQYAQNERLIGVCKNQDSEKDVPGNLKGKEK